MKRVLELKTVKSQRDIAIEAGFVNPNMMSLLKSGRTKMPLDRVPALAKALDCDPRRLFLLALQQGGNETTLSAVEEIFGTVVTRNELDWIEEIRNASGNGDPRLTARTRTALRGIFGK
ncbi:helix-turn-helix transcriptional regulator [Nioella ostreopsis]|uniref:helix-turn-helix transcriptional regulator n=1 Tax=Nioella ostreopsis TaxID=2448479 RepID=UPI0019824713